MTSALPPSYRSTEAAGLVDRLLQQTDDLIKENRRLRRELEKQAQTADSELARALRVLEARLRRARSAGQ